jgi:hypothetical protein
MNKDAFLAYTYFALTMLTLDFAWYEFSWLSTSKALLLGVMWFAMMTVLVALYERYGEDEE